MVDPFAITSRERLKYEEHFKSLQPVNGFVTGIQAKDFFLQSQLPTMLLGQIWALADTDADGKMNLNEFSIACKLINLKLRGLEIPKAVPPTLLASLANVGGTPTRTPTTGMSPLDPMKSIIQAGGGPPPKPPQPIIPPQSVPQAIIPQMAGNAAQPPMMMPMAGGVPPMIPAVPLIPSQPLIGQTAAMPMHQPPAVIPMTQPAMMGGYMQQPLIPGMGMGAVPPVVPVQPIQPQQPLLAGIDLPLLDLGGVPPVAAPTTAAASVPKIPAGPTPPQSAAPSRPMSISDKSPSLDSPGSGSTKIDWAIQGPAKLRYTQLFNTTDRNRSGYLTGTQARNIMVQTKLPQPILAQIWSLSDMDSDGRLGCEEFLLAMYLCDLGLKGEQIPKVLPPELIPPSFRKPSATSSRHNSIVGGSRHGSVSSQGAPANLIDPDPLAGLPQSSFEDKRKENFDKGQAELERRRKALADIQKKEQDERERKEREENEKREKARLEAEMKKQQELEREMQRQREAEQEREEQRLRELERKEAARKELEKQRQSEWEAQKIQEMQQQRQREQEKVLKLKAQNQSLSIEVGTLNDRIKELSQKICDTRVGVSNVKTVIDGMRTTRDTQMTEMAQLKARVKEQNARLVQLSQEKAKLDAKTKNSDGSSSQESQAAFNSKQLIIKQLQDKLENLRSEIDAKTVDINTNTDQLTEVKQELATLIKSCEQLYSDYDIQRIQVLELKHNRKNVSMTSAWDTNNSWGADEPTTVAKTATTNYADTTPTATVAATVTPTAASTAAAPTGYVKYRAIFEFQARNEDEITFNPGDIIMVPLENNAEPGWLGGEINGHTGWFPESYVEKVEEEADVTFSYDQQNTNVDNNSTQLGEPEVVEPEIDEPTINSSADTTAYNGANVEYYVALYPYQSVEVGDLSFEAGDTMVVTKKDGEWWTGKIGDRVGLFPSNYVQISDQAPAPVISPVIEKSEILNGTQKPVAHQIIQSPKSPKSQQLADDLRKEAEADSEVFQINTQQNTNEPVVEQYRSASTTSAMSMRGTRKGEVAQVIAPYEATSTEQLTLARGQLIMIRKKTDTGWWEGEQQTKGRRRQIGWFPATYVKILQGGRNSGRNTPVSSSRVELSETVLDKVIALYPYKALNDDELSFEKDDIISVMGRDEPEWWRGELNGITGLFPSNYVGPFVTSGNV